MTCRVRDDGAVVADERLPATQRAPTGCRPVRVARHSVHGIRTAAGRHRRTCWSHPRRVAAEPPRRAADEDRGPADDVDDGQTLGRRRP